MTGIYRIKNPRIPATKHTEQYEQQEIQLAILQAERYTNKQKIKNTKRSMHRSFKQSNKTLFRIFDVMIIIAILFNVGAMVITNALVIKADPGKQFVEANPAMAAQNGWETNLDANAHFTGFVVNIYAYCFIILYYLLSRTLIRKRSSFYALIIFIVTLWLMWGFDFFNDFGYWIGKVIWGV